MKCNEIHLLLLFYHYDAPGGTKPASQLEKTKIDFLNESFEKSLVKSWNEYYRNTWNDNRSSPEFIERIPPAITTTSVGSLFFFDYVFHKYYEKRDEGEG